jgi:tRNA(Met) cytidine acetyltransferase
MTVFSQSQNNFEPLHQIVKNAQRQGIRRLLVFSGDREWCYRQAERAFNELDCRVLWLSNNPTLAADRIALSNAHTLLGQELNHAVFDASDGFDADALAAVSGTLKAGSLLVLLTPDWSHWSALLDADSLRWSGQEFAIATPHFVDRVKSCLSADPEVLIWRQGEALQGVIDAARPHWLPPDGEPTKQQKTILDRLLASAADYYVLTAGRGRGKSALAGMLAERWQGVGQCWITAPNKASTEGVLQWSQHRAKFIAPDALAAECRRRQIEEVDWLIVDEAAAIPAALLYQFVNHFPRIFFTTTVLGYEGTGRGFLLKFCAGLPHWQKLTLSSPIRWADNDPLERIIDRLLLLNAENLDVPMVSEYHRMATIKQNQWCERPDLLEQFYGLLTGAHYRTTPLDLRRLLDAPKMMCSAAFNASEHIIGALWAVQEGGVPAALAHDIWAGRRRPHGNLAAQSLSAHAGLYDAPMLNSIRISRIAVLPAYRRQGIAGKMIAGLSAPLSGGKIDYLSVSFGYTDDLWRFWQSCGFHLIHIGSQKEASSGCYSAMAILPLTSGGQQLLTEGNRLFQRRSRPADLIGELLPPVYANDDGSLTASDWQELAGFAFAHRTIESARDALQRLLLQTMDNRPNDLTDYIAHSVSMAEIAGRLKLSGRKALIKHWRQEIAQILFHINYEKASQLQQWVKSHPSP